MKRDLMNKYFYFIHFYPLLPILAVLYIVPEDMHVVPEDLHEFPEYLKLNA